ncbi:MAG: DNA-directed RNA polymerase subunit N [Candidatus Micrarchaeaceae archaeon]|nr:DNA-directed RNA polymerase subunit N [Candidatus Marsarchaeota archaeon]
MMMPVRCFSCGAVIADKWEEYDKRVNKEHEDPAKVLDSLGIKRYCCRRMFVSNIELIDEFITMGNKS